MTDMDKGFKYWLSWIGVLPISIIAGVLVTFPVHWVLYWTLSGGGSPFITPYPEVPEKLLQPFFTALVFVWVASLIAPQHKFKTAVIIAALWIFGAGVTFVIAYLGYHSNDYQLYITAGGLPIIMGIVGAVVGLYLVKKKLSE
jgi:hypothetical protein